MTHGGSHVPGRSHHTGHTPSPFHLPPVSSCPGVPYTLSAPVFDPHPHTPPRRLGPVVVLSVAQDVTLEDGPTPRWEGVDEDHGRGGRWEGVGEDHGRGGREGRGGQVTGFLRSRPFGLERRRTSREDGTTLPQCGREGLGGTRKDMNHCHMQRDVGEHEPDTTRHKVLHGPVEGTGNGTRRRSEHPIIRQELEGRGGSDERGDGCPRRQGPRAPGSGARLEGPILTHVTQTPEEPRGSWRRVGPCKIGDWTGKILPRVFRTLKYFCVLSTLGPGRTGDPFGV